MWLEDTEIERKLESRSPEDVTEAIRAIQARWEGGDRLDFLEPLSASVLDVYEGPIPTDVINSFTTFLLGVEGVPHLPIRQAFAELAKAIAHFVDSAGQHALALSLKVHPRCRDAISATVGDVGRLLVPAFDADRLPAVEFFLSCLLDGKAEARAATLDALATWPTSEHTHEICRGIAELLSEDERARLPRARRR